MCTRHENVHSCSPYIEFVRCKLIYHSLFSYAHATNPALDASYIRTS